MTDMWHLCFRVLSFEEKVVDVVMWLCGYSHFPGYSKPCTPHGPDCTSDRIDIVHNTYIPFELIQPIK